MANKHFEIGKTVLDFAHTNLLNLLEDVPDHKLTHQPVNHGNHALWIVGHIANTDTFFATSLGKREPKTPPEFAGLFGMGSKPTPDASAYPPQPRPHAEIRLERPSCTVNPNRNRDWLSE